MRKSLVKYCRVNQINEREIQCVRRLCGDKMLEDMLEMRLWFRCNKIMDQLEDREGGLEEMIFQEFD